MIEQASPVRRWLGTILIVALAGASSLFPAVRADAVTFAIEYVDNPQGDFAARGWLSSQSLFQRNVAAAAAEWGARLASPAVMLLRVEADRSVDRTGGVFSNGFDIGMVGSRILVEPGPLSRIRTGTNPGGDFFGFDILFSVNSQYVDDNYWIDTTPELRTASVPNDRIDFISIVLHEIGHGLGMAGSRSLVNDASYGTLNAVFLLTFDNASSFSGSGLVEDAQGDPNPMFFAGPASNATFGSPVPLSNVGRLDFLVSQNFYHLGSCSDPAVVTSSLMTGCFLPLGQRIPISALDLAVYEDLGYETLPEPDSLVAILCMLGTLAGLQQRRKRTGA